MRNQGQLILAVAIIIFGIVLLVGNLLDVDMWVLCWPSALILLGVILLLRPQLISSDAAVAQKLLGDIRRRGAWDVTDEEFWLGVGDVTLDMTEAEIPVGETHLRIWCFVAGIKLTVPEDVGVAVSSTAFVTDARFFGRKREGFVTPVRMVSENYELAERKVRLESTSFVGDSKVRVA